MLICGNWGELCVKINHRWRELVARDHLMLAQVYSGRMWAEYLCLYRHIMVSNPSLPIHRQPHPSPRRDVSNDVYSLRKLNSFYFEGIAFHNQVSQ
jgi:hypothetical protein